ncbi:hypothetical protein ACFO25_15100 [Paenactinomyces guangxiensis]|uniref:Uncharacterized protein n=1 Tax=Paenactinomyces guangxiensis TaxID=1490290 RepID=A0A7W1WQ17_9BACL|nr:hypothetical protein [Paenactinomyces guangxiensis]MBA4493813.1 hypothetical protein [Paenactinomyces guangxiensis]MBH8591279.1 hypothetical protein [Paenactinomyces guangxiensis]
MLKIQVEGQADQVYPLLRGLQVYPHIELITHQAEEFGEDRTAPVTCSIRFHSSRSMKMIQLRTAEGTEIHIPMLSLVEAEIKDGITIFSGTVSDIFSPERMGGKEVGEKKELDAK